jgi:aminoglycoside phosphotransferase family enzyme
MNREPRTECPDEAASLALPPLVRALLRPEAYPHPAADIELVETHSSWVVLAGAYAYKLRKPVDPGALRTR